MNTIEGTEYKEMISGEVKEILNLCAVESNKKNGIDKYFAVVDEMNGQFFNKEEEYKYTDYKRDILNALIEKVKAEPVDGAAKIIHFAQVRLELLRDTPKFIVQQILSAADIRAEFERYGRWTKGYDFEFTMAVFDQIKADKQLSAELAKSLLSKTYRYIKSIEEQNEFKSNLEAYLQDNGITMNEPEPEEPRKPGRPKGTPVYSLEHWMIQHTKVKESNLRRLLSESLPEDNAHQIAILITALKSLNVLDIPDGSLRSFYNTLCNEFTCKLSYKTITSYLTQTKIETINREAQGIKPHIRAQLCL